MFKEVEELWQEQPLVLELKTQRAPQLQILLESFT
jgi:hypothetical protein